MNDPLSKCLLLAYLIIMSLIMHLHCALFKEGGKHSRRSGEVRGADTEPGLLFDLVDERLSPVSSALRSLYELFTSLDAPSWEGVFRSLPLSLMSDDIWWKLRRTILVSYGQLWYRLVWRYRGWPWKVASMCDPRIPLNKPTRRSHRTRSRRNNGVRSHRSRSRHSCYSAFVLSVPCHHHCS